MPNWCYNELYITTPCEKSLKQLDDFIEESIITETIETLDGGETRQETKLTFQGVVPMPKSLNITAGSVIDDGVAYLKAKEGDLSDINDYIKREYVSKKLFTKGLPVKEKISLAIKHLEDTLEVNTLTEARVSMENMKKYGYTNWYDWSINNWGTKWDASTNDVDRDNGWLRVNFDTAWSPPEAWLHEVTKKYPLLDIQVRVTEESDMYMGFICLINGRIKTNYAEPQYPNN